MEYYSVNELKNVFFDYFVSQCGHAKIPGSSLVPNVDESVLFTPAGMHPLIPYLTGKLSHPDGNKLVNIQNVVRTGAINQVGIDSCLTFFELFGSWDIGIYDKKEVLTKVWNFLTSKSFLGISKDELYITYFEGDTDSLNTWIQIGVPPDHLCPTKKNWKGPYSHDKICGPNTRIYYDTGKPFCSKTCNVLCNCGKFVELWDVVFFDYLLKNGNLVKSTHPFVDTGAGVERLAMLIQNTKTIYETDLFNDIVNTVASEIELNDDETIKKCRVIADHLRCASFIIGDEISTVPSNKGRGYVLRKIIRRAINNADEVGLDFDGYKPIIDKIVTIYPELMDDKKLIIVQLFHEYDVYRKTIAKNLVQIDKILTGRQSVSEEELETFFNTYGVPISIIKQNANQKRVLIKKE